MSDLKTKWNCRGLGAFTLVELMVVVVVIGLLAGIILAAAGGVRNQAARSQAKVEIAALDAALGRFQNDTGTYPDSTTADPATVQAPSNYQSGSTTLFTNLMGRNFYTNVPAAGLKAYLDPKPTMVAKNTSSSPNYFTDPWGYPYGYRWDQTNSTSTFNKISPDLWSSGGQSGTGSQTNRNKWIANWIN